MSEAPKRPYAHMHVNGDRHMSEATRLALAEVVDILAQQVEERPPRAPTPHTDRGMICPSCHDAVAVASFVGQDDATRYYVACDNPRCPQNPATQPYRDRDDAEWAWRIGLRDGGDCKLAEHWPDMPDVDGIDIFADKYGAPTGEEPTP